MKRLFSLPLLLLLIGLLIACNGNGNDINDIDDDDLREFTLAELSEYDGRDGRDAYIAVDGYVYDVTGSAYWPNGLHQGKHQAGQDLTEEIGGSPHGRANLQRVPRIGIIVDEEENTNDNNDDNGNGY